MRRGNILEARFAGFFSQENSAVKRHIHNDAGWFTALAFMTAALIVPAAHAQIHPGGPAGVALQSQAISLQTGKIPHRPPMPALTLALTGPAAIGAVTTTNLFAQAAIGGGYTTIFALLNTGTDTTTGTLILTGDQGKPLIAALSSPGFAGNFGSAFPITVPSGGSQLITAGPVNPGDPTVSGWARVESSGGSLAGVSTFQFVNGGSLTTIVGILSAPATNVATIPIDDDLTLGTQSRSTGYAIANIGTTDINIKIVLANPDGTVSQTITPAELNPLGPGNHLARFLWQHLNNPNLQFTGSIVLIEQTGLPFSASALVLNSGLFTAIPVVPAAAPGIK